MKGKNPGEKKEPQLNQQYIQQHGVLYEDEHAKKSIQEQCTNSVCSQRRTKTDLKKNPKKFLKTKENQTSVVYLFRTKFWRELKLFLIS